MAPGAVIPRKAKPERLGPQLAAILVKARGERTRREVAEAAQVAPNTLGDVETCRANPTLAYLEALEDVYGIRFELRARPA